MLTLVPTLVEENRLRLRRVLVERAVRLDAPPGRIAAGIGMRRTGKTCLMIREMQRLVAAGVDETAILFVSFEDDRLTPLDAGGLAALVDAFYATYPQNHGRSCHLFLDEIQCVTDWSRVLRRLLDTRDVRLTVSGSSARMLSREIATELRGRSLSVDVWPYAFEEWLRAGGHGFPAAPHGQATRDGLMGDLRRYLNEGGLPDTVDADLATRQRILRDHLDVVLFRDVVERNGITNLPLVRYLMRTLLASAGRSVSLHKLYNDLQSQGRKVGKDTLHAYLSHFEDAYLVFPVGLHDTAPRRAENAPRKMYAVDTGLLTAARLGTDDLGQRFENLVFLDLRRQGAEVSYYQTRERREVDFLATHLDGRRELVQACWDASDPETRAREQTALDEACAETGLGGRIVTPAGWLDEVSRRVFPEAGAAATRLQ